MVKYFMSKDDEGKWHGLILDDSEGTIGQSRQITRFRENVEPALVQFVTKNERFLFSGSDIFDGDLEELMDTILNKNHFKIAKTSLKNDPDNTKRRLGIVFEFESTEE